MTPLTATGAIVLLIPAYNESGSIGTVVREVRGLYPLLRVIVCDDCSTDGTAIIAADAGAEIVRLPCHLGLGGCIQTGYRLAYEMGCHAVVRMDADGQHDPTYLPQLLECLDRTGCEVVIGVREGGPAASNSVVRSLGSAFFRLLLRPILGRSVADPTSGFVAMNSRALRVFSQSFPLEYPEIEMLVVLQRRAFRFEEVTVRMRLRQAGNSSITGTKYLYFITHVLLGVFVNILRMNAWRWVGRQQTPKRSRQEE